MHGYDPVDPGEVPSDLPPLPAIPDARFARPEPEAQAWAVDVSAFPAVARYVSDRGNGPVTVYVVLLEDGYESRFGDGVFHYFEHACFDERTARRYVARCRREWGPAEREWYEFHLRTLTMTLHDGVLACADLQAVSDSPGAWRYDRYAPAQVLQSLEVELAGSPATSQPSPRSSWWHRFLRALRLRRVPPST